MDRLGLDNLLGKRAQFRRLRAAPPTATPAGSWSVVRNGQILEVSYGVGSDFPQYAALHTDSSLLRLNYGKHSAWGTSIILLPSFWTSGRYHQGAPIATVCRSEGPDLVILFAGSICTLLVQGQILLSPPEPNVISGTVIVSVHGDISLDRRLGEAFKPVVLSSMHISASYSDAKSAQVGAQTFQLPTGGWIVRPPINGRLFALTGGSSTWKTNAPTLEIALTEEWAITGWTTTSLNPDDDNVGLWAATDELVRFWEYTFRAKP